MRLRESRDHEMETGEVAGRQPPPRGGRGGTSPLKVALYTVAVAAVTSWATMLSMGEGWWPEGVGSVVGGGYEAACAARRKLKKGGELDMKQVAYFEGKIKVERYIKDSFEEHGYAVVPFEKRLDATFIVGKGSAMHFNWEVCGDSMKHNHIYGQSKFTSKEMLTHTLRHGEKKGVGRAIGMHGSEFYKKGYVGEDAADCAEFMKWIADAEFDGQALDAPHIISKAIVGGHNGKGLKILSGRDLNAMLGAYKRTSRCERNTLFQDLLHDQLTLKGHGFSMRLFFVVLRVKPALVVFARGYVRITQAKFDAASTDAKAHISNSDKVWQKSADGMPHFWSLNQLNNYLYESGLVSDPMYVANTLIPKFCAVFTNVFKSAQPELKTKHAYYGVFGGDMTLDTSLNPWLFEVNYSPELSRQVPLNVIEHMYYDIITMQERLLEKHNLPWGALKAGLRNPKRFTVLVDEQKNYVYSLKERTDGTPPQPIVFD